LNVSDASLFFRLVLLPLVEKELVELFGFYRIELLLEHFFVLFNFSCFLDDLLVNNLHFFFVKIDLALDLI
jgi:hypothetical protein